MTGEDCMLNRIINSQEDKSLAMVQFAYDTESMGKITKASLGMSRFFGYNEDELIGRNISVLMPRIYSKTYL